MKDKNQNKLNFKYLSSKEKAQLKDRIKTSVFGHIQRKRRFRFGLAASAAVIVLLVSLTIANYSVTETSEMQQVVDSLEGQTDSESTLLVLEGNQKIVVSDQESSISYSNSGSTVNIGNSKSYQQDTSETNKLIYNTLIVPYGKRSEIVLSDGTKVWLNSGSKLVFPSAFRSENREVYLEGEAIFEVEHDLNKPFLVASNNHKIEVLGTVFNVSNYKGDSEISTVLKSGSVQINYKSGRFFKSNESLKIKPNQMSIFKKEAGETAVTNVDIEPYFSWRDGVFIFQNDDLKSIMKKIARYYNVEIDIKDEDLANDSFSGYLDVKDSIESVMQTIKDTETSDFDYQFVDDNRIIVNKTSLMK